MVPTNGRTVTVFGGTGFLGRRIVRHLRSRGFPVRIASRHPDRGQVLFGSDDPQLQSVRTNIHDERSVADALAGAYGVVNAVSLYVEHGQETFHSVHVESAERVAAQAHRAGVDRLIHIQESVPMPPHHRATSKNAAKVNGWSGPRSPVQFSSARL
jgi:uncharacterized protein YbjT (DUF2867 family)